MCERCKEMTKEISKEELHRAIEDLKTLAEPIDVKDAMGALDPARLEQEEAAMREVCGIGMREAFGLYEQMAAGKRTILSSAKAKAMGGWISVLIRSRVRAALRAEEMERLVALAGLALKMRGMELGEDNPFEKGKETLH